MIDTIFPPCPTHTTLRHARFSGGEAVWVSINSHVYQGEVQARHKPLSEDRPPCRDRLGGYWIRLVAWEDEAAPMLVLCHEDELTVRERK